MLIVGLTGSIAMGKSTVAAMFRDLGAPVFDADAAVHELYRGPTAALVEAAFPGVCIEGAVDRQRLGAQVLGDAQAMKRLEAIVHPAVGEKRTAFLDEARAHGASAALLDVPLLFETGGDARVDRIVVVSAAPEIQRARALRRPGMDAARFDALLARQTPDAEKREKAHFVIDTGLPLEATRRQVEGRLAVARRIGAPMREIVLDTETTGLDPLKGDRIVEIGAVEIVDRVATGRTYHVLINPERDVPDDAFRIHGHSTQALRDKPVFSAVVEEFLIFVGDDPLVIHNAEFDTRFLNAELNRLGRMALAPERIIDTLALARRKHPGAANSLDALCDRYRIDRSRRVKHGALLDSEILVEVYCELMGGRQRTLGLASEIVVAQAAQRAAPRVRPAPLAERLDAGAESAHRAHLETFGAPAIWLRYLPPA